MLSRIDDLWDEEKLENSVRNMRVGTYPMTEILFRQRIGMAKWPDPALMGLFF